MRAKKIIDQSSMETWLSARQHHEIFTISYRAALRLLPAWGNAMLHEELSKISLMPALRSVIQSTVSANFPAPELAELVARADHFFPIATLEFEKFDHILMGVYEAAHVHTNGANAAAKAAFADPQAGANAAMRDCSQMQAGRDVSNMPLWYDPPPNWFVELENHMFELWDKGPSDRWDFWQRWWVAAKQGKPLTPGLELAILRGVDDETWQNPDATAARIRQIEKQYELLQRTKLSNADFARVMAEFKTVDYTPIDAGDAGDADYDRLVTRWHNRPPQRLDDDEQPIQILWQIKKTGHELEQELQKPNPDPARLEQAAMQLRKLVLVIRQWIVKRAEEFSSFATKAAGAEAGKEVMNALLQWFEGALPLIKDILAFANSLF